MGPPVPVPVPGSGLSGLSGPGQMVVAAHGHVPFPGALPLPPPFPRPLSLPAESLGAFRPEATIPPPSQFFGGLPRGYSVANAMSSSAMYDAQMQTQTQTQAKWACLACRIGKRGCDRRMPSCTRCWRLQSSCVYRHGAEGGVLGKAAAAGSSWEESLTMQRVDAKVPFPVRAEKQMPMLLHSCTYTPGRAMWLCKVL